MLDSKFVFLFACFLDAQPTDAERETWKQVDVVLKDARAILDELQAYNGAVKEIREVYTNLSLLIQILHLLFYKPDYQMLEICKYLCISAPKEFKLAELSTFGVVGYIK